MKNVIQTFVDRSHELKLFYIEACSYHTCHFVHVVCLVCAVFVQMHSSEEIQIIIPQSCMPCLKKLVFQDDADIC